MIYKLLKINSPMKKMNGILLAEPNCCTLFTTLTLFTLLWPLGIVKCPLALQNLTGGHPGTYCLVFYQYCEFGHTTVCIVRKYLAVFLLDEPLRVLDVLVQLLDVGGLGPKIRQLLFNRLQLGFSHLTLALIKQSLPLHLEYLWRETLLK